MTDPKLTPGVLPPTVSFSAARPAIDVPGLEQPAVFCAAALSEGEYGHRAVLVIASEDGSTVTTDQLVDLADRLESLFGDEAPEGSRAWLRAKVAQWQEAAEQLNHRHVRALQEAADLRTALHQARVAAITGRDGALTDALDQVSRLRRDLVIAQGATMSARDELETTRMAHARVSDQLAGSRIARDAEARRAEEAEERYRHERDARRMLAAMWAEDARVSRDLRQDATQRARRRTAGGVLAGALTGAVATALAWRFRR